MLCCWGREKSGNETMRRDLSELESRYLYSCRKHGVLPNTSILSSFLQAKHLKLRHEHCSLEIFLDQLICSDFLPLIDSISASNLSGIDAVDVCQRSSNISLKGEAIYSLLNAVASKLRMVNLIDWSFWKDILGDICHKGMPCRMLNLRFSPIQKLNMNGNFMQLHTLNLDFSIYLTSFHTSCFICMPKLLHLSLCATKVTNLWTTTAALSKLPSLVELRFQDCLCCFGYGPFSASGEGMTAYQQHILWKSQSVSSENTSFHGVTEEPSDEIDRAILRNMQVSGNLVEMRGPRFDEQRDLDIPLSPFEQTIPSGSTSAIPATFQLLEDVLYSSSRIIDDISDMNYLGDQNSSSLIEHATFREKSLSPSVGLLENDEGWSINFLSSSIATETSEIAREKHISQHPSPICFEKYYREYMIHSLPNIKVLDNIPIKNVEREKAEVVFKKNYEYVPYNRPLKVNVVNILQKREMGTHNVSCRPFESKYSKQPYSGGSYCSFSRTLSAAKLCSSPWPQLHPLSKFGSISMEDAKTFRPRQFEYHPCDPSLMVFGTLDGELVVINHERQSLVGYLPSIGTLHSILGLCWLKKYPSKLIAGSDDGSLQLYDISQMPCTFTDGYNSMDASLHTYDEFEKLTSVHANSTDENFIVSGFSDSVALYDIATGIRLQILKDLHREHINVVKFAHHSPSIFATASFDKNVKMWDLRQGQSRPCFTVTSTRGNVMVCFSPDDQYILTSAIDNEVKQLLAVDGRLHTEFHIAPIGSAQNYTRSYYMNGRDYIASGSCEENVVRICCAKTGKLLRDLSLEDRDSGYSMFVQSLRGDPFRMFHMSVLAAYLHPCTKSEIIKVNLLSPDESNEEDSSDCRSHGSSVMGG